MSHRSGDNTKDAKNDNSKYPFSSFVPCVPSLFGRASKVGLKKLIVGLEDGIHHS